MQQLSGTLLNLALYLALVVLGAFLGSRPAVQSRPMPWLGRFQTAALLLLIVTLGAELGANDEIVTSLATIGLNALIITLTSMIGSLLAVHILRKHLLKLDAQGRSRKEAAQEETAREKNQVHVDHSLTILIVATVVLGMLAGHLLLPASVTAHCGAVINLGLYLLLFLVGLDMGRQGNMLQDHPGGRIPGVPGPRPRRSAPWLSPRWWDSFSPWAPRTAPPQPPASAGTPWLPPCWPPTP